MLLAMLAVQELITLFVFAVVIIGLGVMVYRYGKKKGREAAMKKRQADSTRDQRPE